MASQRILESQAGRYAQSGAHTQQDLGDPATTTLGCTSESSTAPVQVQSDAAEADQHSAPIAKGTSSMAMNRSTKSTYAATMKDAITGKEAIEPRTNAHGTNASTTPSAAGMTSHSSAAKDPADSNRTLAKPYQESVADEEFLLKQATDSQLYQLGKWMPTKWRDMADTLGVESFVADAYELDYRNAARQATEMLKDWKMKLGSEASNRKIFDALKTCHMFDVWQKYLNKFHKEV